MKHGKELAGHRIEEPRPRVPPSNWMPFDPPMRNVHEYVRPTLDRTKFFSEVLEARRSKIGGAITWGDIADLLWHAAGVRGWSDEGRAGMPVQWSATPSAGGLNCLHIICINDDGTYPRLYDPINHALIELDVDARVVSAKNREAVASVISISKGCTLRFVSDWSKISGAYENAESLMFRDSGALAATIGLCASWLDLTACSLGFVGDELVPDLGFPRERFGGAGAMQIGTTIVC